MKLVDPGGTGEQVPDCEMPQLPVPEQQSAGLVHASPIWLQLSTRQRPPWQLSVQQSLACVQALPVFPQNSVPPHLFRPSAGSTAHRAEQQVVGSVGQAVPSATHWVEPRAQ